MISEVNANLIRIAESVNAEVNYDLEFKIVPSEVYKLLFFSEVEQTYKICKELYN